VDFNNINEFCSAYIFPMKKSHPTLDDTRVHVSDTAWFLIVHGKIVISITIVGIVDTLNICFLFRPSNGLTLNLYNPSTENAKKRGNNNVTALHREAIPANKPNFIKFHRVDSDKALYAHQTINKTRFANNNSTHRIGTYQRNIGCRLIHIPVKNAILVEWKVLCEIRNVVILSIPRSID
jgi:hypothetical protein